MGRVFQFKSLANLIITSFLFRVHLLSPLFDGNFVFVDFDKLM